MKYLALTILACALLFQPVSAKKEKERDKEPNPETSKVAEKLDDVTKALGKISDTLDRGAKATNKLTADVKDLGEKIDANAVASKKADEELSKDLTGRVDDLKDKVKKIEEKIVPKEEVEKQVKKAKEEAVAAADSIVTKRVGVLDKKLDDRLNKGIFRVGLSIGPRFMLIKENERDGFGNAVISKKTKHLTIDRRDKGDLVLSAILAIQPWSKINLEDDRWQYHRTLGSWLKNSTFLVNINLADISSEGTNANFNDEIEGGLGYALAIHKNFAIGFTVENVFNRSLRKEYIDMVGGPVVIEEVTLDDLPAADDKKFFRDDNLTAFSFKFILFL